MSAKHTPGSVDMLHDILVDVYAEPVRVEVDIRGGGTRVAFVDRPGTSSLAHPGPRALARYVLRGLERGHGDINAQDRSHCIDKLTSWLADNERAAPAKAGGK